MKIGAIHFDENFRKQFLLLPEQIQKKACKTEQLFRENPFHPSLRLHKLQGKLDGLWSISIDKRYRIIFEPQDDGITLFISIGLHAIYDK